MEPPTARKRKDEPLNTTAPVQESNVVDEQSSKRTGGHREALQFFSKARVSELLDHALVFPNGIEPGGACPRVSEFYDGTILGVGAYGTTLRLIHPRSPIEFAVKFQHLRLFNAMGGDKYGVVLYTEKDAPNQHYKGTVEAYNEVRVWLDVQGLLLDDPTRQPWEQPNRPYLRNVPTLYDWFVCSDVTRDSISRLLRNDQTLGDFQDTPEQRTVITVGEMVNGQQLEKWLHDPSRWDEKGIESVVSVYTQILCTVAFLKKKGKFKHGDLHCQNILVTSIEDDKRHPAHGRILRYNLPITDLNGKPTHWSFYARPSHLVKIIDFGHSSIEIPEEQARKESLVPKSTRYDKLWYTYYDDTSFLALYIISEWARCMLKLIKEDKGEQFKRTLGASLEFIRFVTHSIGRHNSPSYMRGKSRHHRAFTIKYLDDIANPKVKDNRGTMGELFGRLIKSMTNYRNIEMHSCAIGTSSNDECPAPVSAIATDPQTNAGEWTIDEALVMNAEMLSGHMVGLQPAPAWTQLNEYKNAAGETQFVSMLPTPEVPHGADSRNVRYPVFRGDFEIDQHSSLQNVVVRYQQDRAAFNALRVLP